MGPFLESKYRPYLGVHGLFCDSKCEASLAKDCQGCLHPFLRGKYATPCPLWILGEIALTIEVSEPTTLGWDIMKQTAMMLRLESPFQVVLYADSSSVIQSPLRAVQLLYAM